MINIELNNLIACPSCGADVIPNSNTLSISSKENGRYKSEVLICSVCQSVYPINDSIPIFLPQISGNDRMNYIEHYEKDGELFNYFEERECKATKHEELRLRQYILSRLKTDSMTILDIGSGGAWLAKEINFKKNKLISFDLSGKNIKKALKRYPNQNHFGVVGDALNPPFKKNSIDCIVASEIIEHLVNPQEFVSQMLNILKPGGIFIISTPYKEELQYYLCIHCNQMTPKNAHLHSFEENKLLSYFKAENISGIKSKQSELVKDIRYFIFGNKALTVLRTYVLLKFLPFSLWKIVDKIANLILHKPAHIIIEYKKEI